MDLASQLSQYQLRYPAEKKLVSKFVALLQEAPRCFTRENYAAHFTGSAFIINKEKNSTLLTHHAKLNRWLQPGGHADGVKDLLKVALTETKEETGLTKISPYTTSIFDLDIHLIPQHKQTAPHYHYDVRYLISADQSEQLLISAESHDLRWVQIADLQNYTKEESVLRMAKKISIP